MGQCKLALLYHDRLGVERDYKKAFDWFEQATKQGNVRSQANLSVFFYYNAEDDTQDEIQEIAQEKEMGIKLI